MTPHNTDEVAKAWQFYVEGDEILICFPRDAVQGLGDHVHLRLNGPMAFLLGGSLLHLLQHDAEDGGPLTAALIQDGVLP